MLIGYDFFGGFCFQTKICHPSYNEVKLSHGQYDEIYIDENILITSENVKPDNWGFATVLNAKFRNNLEGGSISADGSVIKKIKIQRRNIDELQWIDVMEIPYSDKLFYEVIDKYVQNDFIYQYSLVPIAESVEGIRTISGNIRVNFEGTFISDSDNNYKLLYDVEFDNIEHVNPSSILEPLNSQYPVVTYSNLDYRKSNITATFISPESINGVININMEKQGRDKLLAFIKNRKPKIIRSQNGEIMLISIIGNPSEEPNNNVNGIAKISFSFVEIGRIDNNTLSANGLIKKVQEV